MLDLVLRNPWIRALGALVLLLFTGGILYLMLPILTALLFSFLFAYVFAPVVDFAARWRIPRMVAIMTLLILMLVGALALPLYLATNVVYEAERLVSRARGGITEERLDLLLDELPLRDAVIYLGWAPQEEDFNARAVIIEQIGEMVRENALLFIRNYGMYMADMGKEAGRSAAQIITSAGAWALSVVVFFVNLSLFVFVAVYLLRDYNAFINGVSELVPPRHRPHLNDFMLKINLQLRSLLRGQLIVCASLAVMYAVGLHCAGAPFAIFIALFGGAASIVPYIGPTLTIMPAALLTLLFYGFGANLFWVFITFGVVQIIETYFLTPRVLGSKIGLNPVWVIVAFMVFSAALGIIGVVLAVPIAAILKVVIEEGATYYKQSAFYSASAASSSSKSSDPPAS